MIVQVNCTLLSREFYLLSSSFHKSTVNEMFSLDSRWWEGVHTPLSESKRSMRNSGKKQIWGEDDGVHYLIL